ncbi:MAG TPA: TIGR01777 family oxidoreductase [Solirubrobacterales bacterium]|nr:TIGR01777 family oxidoreductase [Solirubrobacterales bacterium]
MRVLVTGASGMIGTALCDALFARGDDVAGLTRDPGRARSSNPRVHWHRWEPTLERPDPAAFEGVDGVVNLIGEKVDQRWTEEAKQRIMESRRQATHNLVQAIEALEESRRPKVLVSQSAIGYYGDRGDEELDETSAPGSGFISEVPQAWEQAAHELDNAGVRVVVVRTGLVLTGKGGLLKEMLTPFKLGVGGPLAGGKMYFSWIHLDDEVGILLWALDDERVSGTVNATAPEPVTNKEFSKALGRAVNRPAIAPVPGFVLDLKFGSEFGHVLRGGQRVLPRRTQELGYSFKHPVLEEALQDLV